MKQDVKQKFFKTAVEKEDAKLLFYDAHLGAYVWSMPIIYHGIDLERKILFLEEREEGETKKVELSYLSAGYKVVNTSEIVEVIKRILENNGKNVRESANRESAKSVSVAVLWTEEGQEVRTILVRNSYRPGEAIKIYIGKVVENTVIPLFLYRYIHSEIEMLEKLEEDLVSVDSLIETWNKLKTLNSKEILPKLKNLFENLKLVKIDKKTGKKEEYHYGNIIYEAMLNSPTIEEALVKLYKIGLSYNKAQYWKRRLDKIALNCVEQAFEKAEIEMPVVW
jgi:hypothetical protein